ncbi:MAG: nuclear transport factor 2 family protein [Salinirussus sp.]
MAPDSLADIHAIQNLKHDYCARVDAGATEALFELFTDDATIGYGDGRDDEYTGAEEVREWCEAVPGANRAAHLAVCPRIDVGDDEATGRWKYTVFLDWGDDIELGVGQYREAYRREDGRWRITRRIADRTITANLGPAVEPR